MVRAKFSHRVFAYSIDLTAIAFLQVILGGMTIKYYEYLCRRFGAPADFDVASFLSQFCGAFFFVGYFTFVQGLSGTTIGKRFFKIQVVDGITHKPVGIKKAYWRSLAYVLSSWTYCVGFILPLFRKDKLTLHDLLCNTLVVSKGKNAEQTSPQLELPFLAPVHRIQSAHRVPDHASARTRKAR